MTTPRFALTGATILGLLSLALTSSAAAPRSVTHNGKTYYLVNAADTAMNSGNKVCAAVGRSCAGYTAFTTDVCTKFHPTARKLISVNGSKAGFFCDGAPQKGLACEKNKNTCQVCPACNVNMDCTTDLTSMNQFREAYVECGTPLKVVKSSARSSAKAKSSVKSSKRSSVRSAARSSARSVPARGRSSARAKGYGPLPLPKTTTLDPRIGKHPGSFACEFYQMTKPGDSVKSNKKLVTCRAYKAADNFCVIAMQSRFAKAVKCEDSGIIVCTNPCKPPEYQVKIKQCAFDNDRPRGPNASPLEFCDGAMSTTGAKSSASAKKKVGEKCAHGGECNTTFCVGVQDYYKGMQYFCSCSQWKYDTSCGK